jgi:hypothetical protein
MHISKHFGVTGVIRPRGHTARIIHIGWPSPRATASDLHERPYRSVSAAPPRQLDND